MATTPTTELEAINRMLRVIGESPASSLLALPDDGVEARQVLADVTREVLTEGWHFNTDEDFPVSAEATAPYPIYVPATAVKFDVSRKWSYADRDLVIRGGRLYDRTNHTYSFEGVTIKADITWLFEFEELPEQLRQYLVIKAARQFSDGDLANDTIHRLTQLREDMARALWEQADDRQAGHNALTDNRTTSAIFYQPGGGTL